MLTFSSHLNYHVFKDGSADLTESRIISNATDKPVTLKEFSETLPEGAEIPKNEEPEFTSGKKKRSIEYEIQPRVGTSRFTITLPAPGHEPFVCQPGDSMVKTRLHLPQFYRRMESGIYLFSFHHRLPKLTYLANKAVSKKITIKLEKPHSRWLNKWVLLSDHQPSPGYKADLGSLNKHIQLQFAFTLQDDSYWANTVVLAKRTRILPLMPLVRITINFFKNRMGASNEIS